MHDIGGNDKKRLCSWSRGGNNAENGVGVHDIRRKVIKKMVWMLYRGKMIKSCACLGVEAVKKGFQRFLLVTLFIFLWAFRGFFVKLFWSIHFTVLMPMVMDQFSSCLVKCQFEALNHHQTSTVNLKHPPPPSSPLLPTPSKIFLAGKLSSPQHGN